MVEVKATTLPEISTTVIYCSTNVLFFNNGFTRYVSNTIEKSAIFPEISTLD